MKRLLLIGALLLAALFPSGAWADEALQDEDPCAGRRKLVVLISQTANTQLVVGEAGLRFFVCSALLVQAPSSTQTFSVVSGTGSTCGTSTGAVLPAASAANGSAASYAYGDGNATIAYSDTDAENLCLFQSGSDRITGAISYVLAPF